MMMKNSPHPTEPIPFARPLLGKGEEEAVLRVLRSGWLTTGKEALAFEEEFSRFLAAAPSRADGPAGGRTAGPAGGPADGPTEARGPAVGEGPAGGLADGPAAGEGPPLPCLAVNSATSGLHLALEACGVRGGDLVLLPSYTFTSTAEVVRYLGALPVFIDLAPDSFHMDSRALEATLERLSRGLRAYPSRDRPPGGKADHGGHGDEGFGPRGRAAAVMPVHYGGLPRDMAAIMDSARRYNLKVVEDAAHAFPSYRAPDEGSGDAGDRPPARTSGAPEIPASGSASPSGGTPLSGFAGTWGDAGVYSFYATKTISTGEGGMVVCGNRELAKRISVMRSHGIDRGIWNRYTDSRASWYYEVLEAGFKYNLPDLLAGIGRVQLGRAWEFLRMRQEIAAAYDSAFGGDPHFSIPPTGPGDARHLYPLRLKTDTLRIGRDEFAARLQEGGVGISVHFIPLHTMPYYRGAYNLEPEDFPRTMASFRRELSLPIWHGMDAVMVNRVIDLVQSTATHYTA